ncbi:TolC family protein [Fibrobacterales bacterium]|nr:TolC family protein [Fibrobacterales bacterium]
MQYVFFLIGFFSTAVFSNENTTEKSLTLQSALQILMKKSPTLNAHREVVEQAENKHEASMGKFLPQLSIKARSTMINDPIAVDLNPIRSVILGLHPQVPEAAIPSFEVPVQDDVFHNLSASVIWPIFTGGRLWANYSASKQGMTSARLKHRHEEQKIKHELMDYYFKLLLSKEVKLLYDSVSSSVKKHTDNAEKLAKNGMIAYAEKLRADVALAEAKNDLRVSVRNSELANLALQSKLHFDKPINPSSELFLIPNLLPLDHWIQKAKLNHPLLKLLKSEADRSEAGVIATRGAFLPTVALFGNKELYTEDLTMLEPEWSVGIVMTYPLFNGGTHLQEHQSAKSVKRQINYHLNAAKTNVELLVEKQYREVVNALEEVSYMEEVMKLAEENLRAQSLAFKAGLTTSLHVMDAEQSLLKVRVGRLKALYTADMSYISLNESCNQIESVLNIMKDVRND